MSALLSYISHHAHHLDPTEKLRILDRLSDDLIELAHMAFLADRGTPGKDEDIRDRRARMRRNAPALVALSDTDLDLALDIATHITWDAVAADTPAIIRNLQLNAIKIAVWMEVLEGIDDWDSPPALAIRQYADALAAHQWAIVCEPSDRLDRAHAAMDARDAQSITARWRDVEATLPPGKISEVIRYIDAIDDLWQQARLRFFTPPTSPP